MSDNFYKEMFKHLLQKTTQTADPETAAFKEIEKAVDDNLDNLEDLVKDEDAKTIRETIMEKSGLSDDAKKLLNSQFALGTAIGELTDNKEFLAHIFEASKESPKPDLAQKIKDLDASSTVKEAARTTLETQIDEQKANLKQALGDIERMKKQLMDFDGKKLRSNLPDNLKGKSDQDLMEIITDYEKDIRDGKTASDKFGEYKALKDALKISGPGLGEIWKDTAEQGSQALENFVEWSVGDDSGDSPLAKSFGNAARLVTGTVGAAPGYASDTWNTMGETPNGRTGQTFIKTGLATLAAMWAASAGIDWATKGLPGIIGRPLQIIGKLVAFAGIVLTAYGFFRERGVNQGTGKNTPGSVQNTSEMQNHEGGPVEYNEQSEIALAIAETDEAEAEIIKLKLGEGAMNGNGTHIPQTLIAAGKTDAMPNIVSNDEIVVQDSVIAKIGMDNNGKRTLHIPQPEMGLGAG